MSRSPQHHLTARQGPLWALVTGLLVTVFIAVVQIPSPARPARSDQPFYSDEISATVYVLDNAHAVSQDKGSAKNDKWPALFDMGVELLTQGEVLNKWSHARIEIARELKIVDRCRNDNVCPPGA